MVRHVAVFTFSDAATDERVEALKVGLVRLSGLIPEIRAYAFGTDLALGTANSDFAVVADFDDVEGYRAYAGNPDHEQLIVDLVRPIIATRHSIQYEF